MDRTYGRSGENLLNYLGFLKDLGIKRPGSYNQKNVFEFRNFNGDERKKIFQNIKFTDIFPSMMDAELKQTVWDDFYLLIHEIKDDMIKENSELKRRLVIFFDNFRKISFENSITPYTHILVSHVFQQIDSLGKKGLSINDFSMQGIEKLNDFTTKYYQRSSNKKYDYIRQVLHKRSRIEILQYHDNLISILDI